MNKAQWPYISRVGTRQVADRSQQHVHYGEYTMFNKAKPARDPFTFSLGGMVAIRSFVFAPAIADDRINKAWDERFRRGQAGPDAPRSTAPPRVRWAT